MLSLMAASCSWSTPAPVQLIIDTDLGFDVDDVGAIAVAHALADLGHVDIIGVVCNTGRDSCIVGVDIVNTYYGRANTSIGSFKGKFGSYTDNGQDGHYVNDLKNRFPHTVNGRNEVPSAIDVYRTALTKAADKSVTIASIGEATNLQDLLRSEMDLVKQKVKRIVYMDGDFNFGCELPPPPLSDTSPILCFSPLAGLGLYLTPVQLISQLLYLTLVQLISQLLSHHLMPLGADGSYGPNDECWKSAQYVVANMPSPDVEQIFQLHGDNHNGWWVGNSAKCGYDNKNPVKVAYSDMCKDSWGGACDNYGRDSWDPNTVDPSGSNPHTTSLTPRLPVSPIGSGSSVRAMPCLQPSL